MGAKSHPTPPQDELLYYYKYDPKVGLFIRNHDGYYGGLTHHGYRVMCIWGRDYKVHRLIWKYMTGEEAEYIDHIDGNKDNNKWDNLRSVSRHINNRNTKLYKNNKTGYVGVNIHERDNTFQSILTVNRKQVYLGYFRCPTAAYFKRLKYIKDHPELQYSETHGKR